MSEQSCRDLILEAARRLETEGHSTFTIPQVLNHLRGSGYPESTIRTHVSSRMCIDAPDHHGTVTADLERVGRGQYRLKR